MLAVAVAGERSPQACGGRPGGLMHELGEDCGMEETTKESQGGGTAAKR